MPNIKVLTPLMSFLAGDPVSGIFAAPAPLPTDGVRTTPANGQVVTLEIPKNQLQGLLYIDYTKGSEPGITIDVVYKDVNIPAEEFHELQKTDLATHLMAKLSRFRFTATEKGYIPFPLAYRHGKLKFTVTADADGDGQLRMWFNDGALVDEPCPAALLQERSIGEGWELPSP